MPHCIMNLYLCFYQFGSCENSSDQELDLGMTNPWHPCVSPVYINVLQTLDISNLHLMTNLEVINILIVISTDIMIFDESLDPPEEI